MDRLHVRNDMTLRSLTQYRQQNMLFPGGLIMSQHLTGGFFMF